jgi:hypothetical protein
MPSETKNKSEKETMKIFGRMWKLQTLHGRFDNLCKQAELPSAAPFPSFCLRSKYIEKIRSAELRGLACFPFLSTCYSNICFLFAFARVRSGADHSLSAAVGRISHIRLC